MSDLVVRESDTLAIAPDQSGFTERQVAALAHIGVENAKPGDLEVFFHRCKATGLDPFSGQIHMIGRNTFNSRTNRWEKKQTIQTGIDGFRLIGRRAADSTRDTVSVGAPEWAHEDGSWRSVWARKWGYPIAARVTIQRAGQPFTGVALFEEYRQTKKDGGLTQMWEQRPAGQLAKCAEALAWRMAFPHDLAGLYTDDEMGQADRPQRVAVEQVGTAADRMRTVLGTEKAPPIPEDDGAEYRQPTPLDTGSPLAKRMFALLGEHGISDRDEALAYVGGVIGRQIESRNDLTVPEVEAVVADLEALGAES